MRRDRLGHLAFVVGGLYVTLFAACTSSGPPSVTVTGAPTSAIADAGEPHPRSTQWRITGADIEQTAAPSLMEAIRRLRPEYLRGASRTPGRPLTSPAVYVNGLYDGDTSMLRTLPLSVIREVSFLHPHEAFFRFGLVCTCEGGVILVVTQVVKSR